ncbi:MAG: winged helix-turn-helix transcriptional regulator [Firmicutes bacterium]|nr:winged helix-turn-helix transcriptional regulator [Bacillota bacterium]
MKTDFAKYVVLLKALADETRLRIFDMLNEGELCACDILDEFTITQPTLSYHMKILSESGLVHSRRDGVWMKYSINEESLLLLRKFFDGFDADSTVERSGCEKC